MKKTNKTFAALLLIVITNTVLFSQKFNPNSGETVFLLGQNFIDEYQDFIDASGKIPAGSSHYGEFFLGKINQGNDGADEGFIKWMDKTYPGSYAEVALSFKDNAGLGGYGSVGPDAHDFNGRAMVEAMLDVANGKWDDEIDSYAQLMKSQPETKFLLRIGYEVSIAAFANDTEKDPGDILNYYANTLHVNCLEGADTIPEWNLDAYRDGYNYIANRIRNVNGVNNVAFVYHPVRSYWDAYWMYPGNEYVDYLALSIFNHDVCMPMVLGDTLNENCPIEQSLDANTEKTLDWAHNDLKKGIMIGESGIMHPVMDNVDYFKKYLDKVKYINEHYDVKFWNYINIDWNRWGWTKESGWGDSRLQTNPEVLNYWLNMVNQPRYKFYDGNKNYTVPVAPSGLVAEASSTTQINLGWMDESDNEQGFKIEIKKGSADFTYVGKVGVNETGYSCKDLEPGTEYKFRVYAYAPGGDSERSNEYTSSTMKEAQKQSSFFEVNPDDPSIVQFEFFDKGGEGVAYHDDDRHWGDLDFRLGENVDVQSDGKNGRVVSYTQDEEWLEYTIDMNPGNYDLELNASSATTTNGFIRLTLDGKELGEMDPEYTGGWLNFEIYRLKNIHIQGGNKIVLRVDIVGGNINLDWLRFVKNSSNPTCSDGIQNGDEQGIDCGGSCPNSCGPNGETCEEFGISYVDDNTMRVYHKDNGWTASWQYICVDGYCVAGEKKDGYYYKDFEATLGQQYKILFKVQDEATSQYITPEQTVTFTKTQCSFTGGGNGPTCNDGIQNGDETGVDCGGTCPACPIEPTCNDGIQNGNETGIDCGGSCSTICEPGGSCGEFGISYVDNNTMRVYHEDNGWTASWQYLCVDGHCVAGEKKDGYYYKDFEATLGLQYKIQFKVQDEATNQYITPEETVTFTEKQCSFAGRAEPTCDDGIQNGDETGVDCGGSCANSCAESSFCAQNGVSYKNNDTIRVYYKDEGWNGSWNYVCLDGYCIPGNKKDGYYFQDYKATLGQEYTIQLKVQDDNTGAYLSEIETVIFSDKVCDVVGNLKAALRYSSMNHNQKSEPVLIYPNPARNTIIIQGIKDKSPYRIINPTGILMHSGNERTLDISELPAGVYYIIFDSTGLKERFIKLR